jgi:response regulator RpfG family c-di-GMP phosphodiesterase
MPRDGSDRISPSAGSPVMPSFRLLVAAEPTTARRLTAALGPFGYQIELATTEADALASLQGSPPDVAMVSGGLPGASPFNLMRAVRTQRLLEDLPIVFVTAPGSPEQEMRAFQMGADDVVGESTPDTTMRARLRVLLRQATTRRRLSNERRRMELHVADRTRELMEITLATVAALEKAAEMTDQETGNHMTRVAEFSALLAVEIGCEGAFVEKIRLYAPLHDVGKVGIPHEILKKEGVLTKAEFDEMKKHTLYGHELLKAARADPIACNIALSHHERHDGSGYPNALRGDQVPLEARLVSVADVFDALTTKRHYKEAMHPDDAIVSISEELAGRFDLRVVKAFLARKDDVMDIFRRYQ